MMLLAFLLPFAFAAEFPLADYRAMELGAKLLVIGEDLAVASGKEANFDPALALQACDGIDKKRALAFKTMSDRRVRSQGDASSNKPGWEDQIRSDWAWTKVDGRSLNEDIKARIALWPVRAKAALPCTDPSSIDLIENIATDTNAADDQPVSLCVRMVKAFRKSGVCGRPVMPPNQQTY